MLLCLTCVRDKGAKEKYAKQVLTCLETDHLSDADRFYGCRCLVYCEPFPGLEDMHARVLGRIVQRNQRATSGVRLYSRLAAQTAIYMWKFGSWWWSLYVFQHVEATVQDSVAATVLGVYHSIHGKPEDESSL